jgi:branched-chain amino acid transport system permease protein
LSVARASEDQRSTGLGAALTVERGAVVRGAVIAGFLAVVLFVLPTFLGNDWVTTLTSVAIYSIVALGFGVLYGRVGMISLGQVALLSVGVWVGTRFAYATSWPFPVLLLITGAITCVIGVLVGLPALRLSGLYLALITLMFAGATTIVIAAIDFPNGGGGFKGRTSGLDISGSLRVRRPSWGEADTAYYRYVVIVAAVMFLLALIHVSGKSGRAWAAIRASEPAALAAGVNITLYKLWAFALASFMTGVAGCLLTAQIGVPRPSQFQTQDSLVLAATAMIGGIFSLWGAVLAGVFGQFLPFLLSSGQLWGWVVNVNILYVIFGVGLLQVLLTAPGGIVQQFPKDMANLGRLLARQARRLTGPRGTTA